MVNNKISQNEISCKTCLADCCKEVAVSINTPKTKKDWDEIKWLVLHKNVQVYKDFENDWLVEFFTPCEKLSKTNKCTIYKKRPLICKEHQSKNCIKTGPQDYYKILFKTINDVEKYLQQKNKKK
ncbi:MAG: YkgJ family cysteine cluster protein [Candidatus ainarchaeum sp.]|nr:YkgJ family cysteine cluster protein [Candidatus ainarchaeum sp.]